jgi:hypothetical protein
MSIVPKEVIQDIRETWPARDMPLLEYAIERAAEWALEHAAQVALKEAQDRFIYETYTQTMADAMVDAIRALIKGGESDGQG